VGDGIGQEGQEGQGQKPGSRVPPGYAIGWQTGRQPGRKAGTHQAQEGREDAPGQQPVAKGHQHQAIGIGQERPLGIGEIGIQHAAPGHLPGGQQIPALMHVDLAVDDEKRRAHGVDKQQPEQHQRHPARESGHHYLIHK